MQLAFGIDVFIMHWMIRTPVENKMTSDKIVKTRPQSVNKVVIYVTSLQKPKIAQYKKVGILTQSGSVYKKFVNT